MTDMWGTDGGYIGSFKCEKIDPEINIYQVQLTVCGAKNFDSWWHYVLAKFHKELENAEGNEAKGKGVEI